MSKLKIVKFGDERGVGAVVEVINFFGIVRTWTLVPDKYSDGSIRERWTTDKWVCRETGGWDFRDCCNVCRFYAAQFNTSSRGADGQ